MYKLVPLLTQENQIKPKLQTKRLNNKIKEQRLQPTKGIAC